MLIQVNLVCLFFQCLLCEICASNFFERDRYVRFNPVNYDNEYYHRNSRYTYSNFDDERLDAHLKRPAKANIERLPTHQWDQSLLDTDRLDFHYPNVEFQTKNRRKYNVYSQEDNENDLFTKQHQKIANVSVSKPYPIKRKSNFKKQMMYKNDNQYQPVKLSYVEKISKPARNVTIENKYKEYEVLPETDENNEFANNGRKNLHEFLKKYLINLLSSKYNISDPTLLRPSNYSKLNDGTKGEVENKFIGGVFSKFKKKVFHKKKLFSLFTIVQFNNTQCNATSSLMSYLGVCYTPSECNRIEGTAVGNCASGYGVCCVVFGTCGGWASQNCSYFRNPNYPDYDPMGGDTVIVPTTLAPTTTTANPSPTPDPRLTWYLMNNYYGRQSDDDMNCVFSVYKASSDVNRFRIDFLDLELAGPTNGSCIIERLVISGQNQNDRIPAICGYNTGQHVYVDVSMLSGPLQISVLSTMNLRKRFNIRICQYTDTCLEPTSNCLQYYRGVSGTISSFNYDQVAMFNRSVPGYFNDLNYAICIRREAGYCSITFTNLMNGMEYPFQFVNIDSDGMSTIPAGEAGVGVIDCPDDYIVIDGVRLCGDKFNDGTMTNNASVNAPVTDTNAGPIVIQVRTDSSDTGIGFKLFYTQNRCMMNK